MATVDGSLILSESAARSDKQDLPFSICHFSFDIDGFNLEVQQMVIGGFKFEVQQTIVASSPQQGEMFITTNALAALPPSLRKGSAFP